MTRRLAAVLSFVLFGAVLSAAPVDFGSVALDRSKTAVVMLTMTSPAHLSHLSIRTLGKENADFLLARKGTCHLNAAYSAKATCTVRVAFKPHAVGARLGAVVLTDSSGAPIATTYLHGLGTSVKALRQLQAKTSIDGLSQPNGLAIDERGSLFVVTSKPGNDIHSGAIFEEQPLPSGSFVSIPRVTGIYGQRVIAIDGNHNLFVAGVGMYIYKETRTPYGSYIESTIGGQMGAQCGLAVDGAGNLYVSDCNNNVLYKETLLTNGSYVQSVVIAHRNAPTGVAVDGDGALYVALLGDKKIVKETPAESGYAESTIDGPFVAPQGLAFDSGGNLYVSDFAEGAVDRETLTSAGYVQTKVITGTNCGYLAIDAAGNLYVSDPLHDKLFAVALSTLPAPAAPSDAPKVEPQQLPQN